MAWYDTALHKMESGRTYSHGELVELLREDNPLNSVNSFQWAISGMMKAGSIRKTGYNQYEVSDGKPAVIYRPHFTVYTEGLIGLLADKFSDAKFIFYETGLLNEFMDEQAGLNVIFLQVERSKCEQVFRYMQDSGIPNVLYKPPVKDYDFYRTNNGVVVTNLFSECPISREHPHEVCIEKMLVDIFCDRLIRRTYPADGYSGIVENARLKYIVETPRLLRYANRRGKGEEILLQCPGLEEGGYAVYARNNSIKERIIDAAADAVRSFSGERKEFYDYIVDGKLSQGEIAKLYHITPQAVTNRIHRMYRAVIKTICETMNINEKGIKRYLKYENEVVFLKMTRL